MKIQVSKKGMVTLLDAMILKNEAQQEMIGETLEEAAALIEDSELMEKAIDKAKMAIAALTGTELVKCEDCPGHLSETAKKMVKDALAGDSMYDVGFVAGHQKCAWQNADLSKARLEEIAALKQEIERLKGLPTIDHSNCAPKPATPSPETPREAATEPWRVFSKMWFEWWLRNTRNGWTDDAAREATDGAAGGAYGAGVLAERRRSGWPELTGSGYRLDLMEIVAKFQHHRSLDTLVQEVYELGRAAEIEAERGSGVPRRVHVIVAERTAPIRPLVWVFIDNDRCKQEFDRLSEDRSFTAITYHHEEVRTEVVPVT